MTKLFTAIALTIVTSALVGCDSPQENLSACQRQAIVNANPERDIIPCSDRDGNQAERRQYNADLMSEVLQQSN